MFRRVTLLLLLLLPAAACVPEGSPTVTILVDGETRTLPTGALTVRELLFEAGITLGEDDRVTPAESSFVTDGLTVRVIRVEQRTVVEQRDVPFERQTVRDASVPAGETRLLNAGVTGLEELTYRVTIEDGVETGRLLVRRATIQEPQAEVILVGFQADVRPVPITGTVAYVANHDAWVIQTTSPNRRRLTYSGDLDGHVFSLSPDGAYLLFTRVTTGTGASAPLNVLAIMDTSTADAAPVELDVEDVLWADWAPECKGTPNGRNCRIAYSTGVRVEGNPDWRAENDLWIAWPRAYDGWLGSRNLLIEPGAGGTYGWWGGAYAWSPDGWNVAYARAGEVGVVRIYDGRHTVLARFPPYCTYAAWVWTPTLSWSRDGSFIAATLHGPSPTGESPEDSPVFDVWVLAADGSLAAELAGEVGMWAVPLYAGEGNHISFGRARSPYVSSNSSYDLYVMDRDGSDRRRLFPPEGEIGLDYAHVAWGPGGERLIAPFQGNLYMVSVPGGEVSQLTDEGGVTTVRWDW